MQSARILTLGALLLAASATALQAGGWVVITLKTVRVHEMPGEGGFIYTVRQHGYTPIDDLNGHVVARKGDRVVRAAARPLVSTEGRRSSGAYVVSFTFPEPGNWTVELTAGSGLVGDVVTLPVAVLPPGVEAPPVPLAVFGKQVFEAKGCGSCHTHPAFPGRRNANILDLTGRKYTAESARLAIQNAIGKPTANGERGMPNLGLTSAELDAVSAFLAR